MKPIELKLYDPETNEVVQTYVRSFVPWAILKRAIRMQKSLGGEMSEETLDELAGLVVALFGDKFTVEQVTNGSDAGEMMTVIQEIIARANTAVLVKSNGNPTPAA